MIDWPVASGNAFLIGSLSGLLVAPVAGASTRLLARRTVLVVLAGAFVISLAQLAYGWRAVPGGFGAALAGHLALTASMLALFLIGRALTTSLGDELIAGLAGFTGTLALTLGAFAVGPLTGSLSQESSRWVLAANPFVAVASAAGIDLLHLDLIYRLSPLAHRGVALPAPAVTAGAYAALGLAVFGAAHLRTRSA